MWILSGDHVFNMVERVKISKVRRLLDKTLLTMGAVLGEVFSTRSVVEKGDVFALHELYLSEEVYFEFKYFMTTEWFILTAIPLNDGEGFLNWEGTSAPENTICDIPGLNGRVAMVLKQDDQPPWLITVTRAAAISDATFDGDRLWITMPDGERREFSPNKFVARLSLLRAQA